MTTPTPPGEHAPLAARLAAVARTLRHWAREADRDAIAAADPDAPTHPRYARTRGRADGFAQLALAVAARVPGTASGVEVSASVGYLPLTIYQRTLRLAAASAAAEERAGAVLRAIGWHDALDRAEALLRPLLWSRDRYALALARGENWTEGVPTGVPAEPTDRLIWAHRRLDLPLPVLPRDGGGPPHHADPRALPLTTERPATLPTARVWEARAGRWRATPPTPDADEEADDEGAVDPEAPARARAVVWRQHLLATVPMLPADEAAARLGCSVLEIAARAARHELLVLPTEGGDLLPAFQFVGGAGVLPGLPEVLVALAALPLTSPWVTLDWLVSPVDRDDPRSAVDLLRAGAVAEVIEMARTYGEMGR